MYCGTEVSLSCSTKASGKRFRGFAKVHKQEKFSKKCRSKGKHSEVPCTYGKGRSCAVADINLTFKLQDIIVL